MVGANPNDWEIPLDKRTYFAVRGGSNEQEQKWFIESLWSHVFGVIKLFLFFFLNKFNILK